jgi:hypothetical protein
MIQKLLTIAKGLPWWAWVLVGLAVLYLFNMASGSIYTEALEHASRSNRPGG